MSKRTALSYCGQLVQSQDADKYLWCLAHPPHCREALFALVAFSGELARIPSLASEPIIGHIRFAWWREAVAEIFAGDPVRAHPIAEALKQAVHTHALPRAPLDALLDAREQDFVTAAYETLEALRAYALQSNFPLLELSLHLLGKADDAQRACARRAALLFGMTGILRAVLHQPVLAEKTLPFLLRAEHSEKEAVSGCDGHSHVIEDAVQRVVGDMLQESRQMSRGESSIVQTRVIDLIGKHFLKKIHTGGRHVNSHQVEAGRGWLVFRILLCITFATR